MRKCGVLVFGILLVFICSIASAAVSEEAALQKLQSCIGGVWSDANGHHRTEITYGNINGVRISNADKFSGDEKNGSVQITLLEISGNNEATVSWQSNGSEKSIIINGRTRLLPVKPIQHSESVSGVTLDMSAQQIKELYGAPSRVLTASETADLCGVQAPSWYWNDKWLVTFDADTYTVNRIAMLKGSSHAFDRSVLNCDSALEKFAPIYGWDKAPSTSSQMDLGNGEIMDFTSYPKALMLVLR